MNAQDLARRFHLEPAAAYVRSVVDDPHRSDRHAVRAPAPRSRWEDLVRVGLDHGLKMHRFKRSRDLSRVSRVIGMLHGLNPTDLLDIGSGRGVFLWPLLEALPHLGVTAMDSDPARIALLDRVAQGVERLTVVEGDPSHSDANGPFDGVTLLEVLEHQVDPAPLARAALAAARRFVVVSVPSKLDDNPGHLHLLDRRALSRLFSGGRAISFDNVLGHLVALVKV